MSVWVLVSVLSMSPTTLPPKDFANLSASVALVDRAFIFEADCLAKREEFYARIKKGKRVRSGGVGCIKVCPIQEKEEKQ